MSLLVLAGRPAASTSTPVIPPTVQRSTAYGPRSDGGTLTAPSGAVVVASGGNIQTALTAAGAGGTVFLNNGTYSASNLTVLASQTLMGQSRGGVVISGPGTNAYFISPNSVSNVTLQNFTFQNYKIANKYTEGVVSSSGGNAWQILNVYAKNNTRSFEHTGCALISDCVIEGGALTNQGIGTGPSAAVPVTGLIQYCEVFNCGADNDGNAAGIKTLFCQGAVIQNCYIHHNYAFGIWSDTSKFGVDDLTHHAVDLYNNKCWHNGASGIFYETSKRADIWYNDCQFNGDGSNGHGTAAITGGFFAGSCQIYIGDSHNVDIANNTAGNGPGSIGCADNHAGDSSGDNMMFNVQVHNNTIISGDAGMQVLGARDPNAYSTSKFYSNTYTNPVTFWWSSGSTSGYTSDSGTGTGVGGGTGGSGTYTVDEQRGDVYPGYPDTVSGGTVPAGPNNATYAKHDISPMPKLATVLDWSYQTTKQVWPSDGTWSGYQYCNVWWQVDIVTSDRRIIVDISNPFVYTSTGNGAGSWTQVSNGSSDTSMWTSQITSTNAAPFNQGASIPSSYNAAGYTSLDFSSTGSSTFGHGATNLFFPRFFVPTNSALSIQMWVRIRSAATGVNLSTAGVYANCGSDRFNVASSPGQQVNGATGESRFKRIPVDGSKREIGYHTIPLAVFGTNPPPLLTV